MEKREQFPSSRSPPVPSLVSSLLLLETRLFVIAQGDDNLKCETVGCAAGTACTDHGTLVSRVGR